MQDEVLPAHEINKDMEKGTSLPKTLDSIVFCNAPNPSTPGSFYSHPTRVWIYPATRCSSSRPNPLHSDAPYPWGMDPANGLPGDDDFAKLSQFPLWWLRTISRDVQEPEHLYLITSL